MIAAPNTPPQTLKRVAELGGGYTYCVARAGVTGAGTEMQLNHEALLSDLRTLGAPPPVLGFGISTPEHVGTALAAGAAGVVSGSAMVKILEEGGHDVAASLRAFVSSMKAATLCTK
jgi:tryptophan synthase alpha chain